MFRKIHSNRDPRDTLLSELRNEFKSHFEKASKVTTRKVEKRPKVSFAVMVALILLSSGLCFTVCRNNKPAEIVKRSAKVNAVSDGFSQILSASQAIKQGLALKQQIDSLTAKKILSRKDSEALINDLDRLHQLNKPFSK